MQISTLLEVIEVLVGDVLPVGESYHDDKVYENLQLLIATTQCLINQILEVESDTENRKEYSIKKCHDLAQEFIGDMLEKFQ